MKRVKNKLKEWTKRDGTAQKWLEKYTSGEKKGEYIDAKSKKLEGELTISKEKFDENFDELSKNLKILDLSYNKITKLSVDGLEKL